MFIVVPYANDQLKVDKLPFATIGIGIICIVLLATTHGRINAQSEKISQAAFQYGYYYRTHPYLTLNDAYLKRRPANEQKTYHIQREWISALSNNPQERARLYTEVAGNRHHTTPSRYTAADLMNPYNGEQAPGTLPPLATDPEARELFVRQLVSLSADQLDRQQTELNNRFEQWQNLKKQAILSRFGVVPNALKPLALITHQFLHADVFHLIFNLWFLWLAGCKLEDTWGRGVYVGVYLLLGVAGAAVHMAANVGSAIPMIGASGAIAGLLGVSIIRYPKANIKCAYAYWFFRFRPRFGQFEAPAYFLLPIWFLGELGGYFLSTGPIAYGAHVGGFLTGVGIAVLFRAIGFEQNVLGHEPVPSPDDEPLPRLVALSGGENHKGSIHPGSQTGVSPTSTQPVNPLKERFHHKVEVRLLDVSQSEIQIQIGPGTKQSLGPGDIAGVCVGRIDRLEATVASQIFKLGAPVEPAILIGLVSLQDQRGPILYVINTQHCQFAKLLPQMAHRPTQNVSALTKMIMKTLKTAIYIHGKGPVATNNIPIYENLDGFFRHLEKNLATISSPPNQG